MFGKLKEKLNLFKQKIEKTVEEKEQKENKNQKEEKTETKKNEKIQETIKTKEEKQNEKKTNELNKTPDAKKIETKITTTGKLKSLLKKEIELTEKDLDETLWDLEMGLLESDVEQETAKQITENIKQELIGKKIDKKQIDKIISQEIKNSIKKLIEIKTINLLEEIDKHKPYKILIIGPNGAGKTTSIAKLSYYLKQKGKTIIWSASDTFRAASIEQLEVHSKKLEIPIIKHQYGSDPTAVAFDTVKAAEARKIDVVIIDSAGRQETNKNLIEELKKMQRKIQPNLTIYVGESYTGQTMLQQATKIKEEIGIDGFILTKIDTDAKGGTIISLLYKLKTPILYLGTGQEYKDLQEFTPEFILNRIIE